MIKNQWGAILDLFIDYRLIRIDHLCINSANECENMNSNEKWIFLPNLKSNEYRKQNLLKTNRGKETSGPKKPKESNPIFYLFILKIYDRKMSFANWVIRWNGIMKMTAKKWNGQNLFREKIKYIQICWDLPELSFIWLLIKD